MSICNVPAHTFDSYVTTSFLAWFIRQMVPFLRRRMPSGHAPARATVANVTLADPEWDVEIVVVAAV